MIGSAGSGGYRAAAGGDGRGAGDSALQETQTWTKAYTAAAIPT